jgi:hypothetical protein
LRKEIKTDIIESIDDLAGIRVICLYRVDLARINSIIEKRLKVLNRLFHNQREDFPFGYVSDHYIVMIPEHFEGERYNEIKELKCEIQVRTVAMHAWATISHHLAYKQEMDIPSELKTDFRALSGMFYVADSVFEQFRKARLLKISKLNKSIELNNFDLEQELNIESLDAFLRWKYPERKSSRNIEYSKLLGQLETAGIDSYKFINEMLDAYKDKFLKYEKKYPPLGKKGLKFTRTGIVRSILRDILRLWKPLR